MFGESKAKAIERLDKELNALRKSYWDLFNEQEILKGKIEEANKRLIQYKRDKQSYRQEIRSLKRDVINALAQGGKGE